MAENHLLVAGRKCQEEGESVADYRDKNRPLCGFTLYLLPHNFEESFMASSISRKRNLNSTKWRTSHLRSFVHSSVLRTSSLQRSIAFVNSSMDASWSRINCHCSFIKLLGMACDFSELVSSPDATEWFSMLWAVSSMVGDCGTVIDDDGPLIRFPTAFGMCAKLSRIECIFSQTHQHNFLFSSSLFVVIQFSQMSSQSHWIMSRSDFVVLERMLQSSTRYVSSREYCSNWISVFSHRNSRFVFAYVWRPRMSKSNYLCSLSGSVHILLSNDIIEWE